MSNQEASETELHASADDRLPPSDAATDVTAGDAADLTTDVTESDVEVLHDWRKDPAHWNG